MTQETVTLVINPDPYRVRAQAIIDSPRSITTPTERALAEVVVLLSNHYDELREVFGVRPGEVVR